MFRQGRSLELKGLALLIVLALLVWLSIAFYEKRFTPSVTVSVRTQRAGLQLNDNGDVRMRGALVGRVAGIRDQAGEAVVRIELDAKQVRHIPADVEARILPTTLFGQKYVELVAPGRSGAGRIQAGATIPEDRSAEAVEITDAFDDLEPVLTAVHPQDLSATLQAMSQALEGRGERLGRLAVATNILLERFEGHIPALIEDLRLLAKVSGTYADAMPDLLKVLHNASVISKTVVGQEDELKEFIRDVTVLSRTGRGFFERNEDGLVTVDKVSRPLLELLARFSPEMPCLILGLIEANKRFNSAFYDNKLNSRTVLPAQYPGYSKLDVPDFSKLQTGPNCAGLPYIDQPVLVPHFADGGRDPKGQLVVP